jgi:streptogramin lyase
VANAHGMARDPEGNIWFNVSNAPDSDWDGNYGILGKMDPKTDQLEVFTPPKEFGPVGGFVDTDPQGNVWSSTKAGALRFDPKTKEFRLFKYLTLGNKRSAASGPYGVTADSEGNGWWSEFSEDIEGKGVVATGKSEDVKLPLSPRADSVAALFTADERKFYDDLGGFGLTAGVPWQEGPRRPGADKHGDSVWVPDWWGQNLLKIDIHTNKTEIYPIPTFDSGIYETKIDKDHVVWMDFQNSDTVAKFDPRTKRWVEYSLPTVGAETHQIGIIDHNGPTEVTLAYFRVSKVARMQFRTRQQMKALEKRAQDALKSGSPSVASASTMAR